MEAKLTLIEANILKILYLNAQSVVSRDEIMNSTKGSIHNPLDRSIDIHINKIRKKIEDDPANPRYISTIRGIGYRLNMS
ncbi:winged helix-turn-helix domain-containing protein [Thiofilum sp.]|uniref:winged helix-turn-helix domain-containing protein n=1 Tax=Thiofilum sp. TaxID=2212733 RepID=UPI003BAE91A6